MPSALEAAGNTDTKLMNVNKNKTSSETSSQEIAPPEASTKRMEKDFVTPSDPSMTKEQPFSPCMDETEKLCSICGL